MYRLNNNTRKLSGDNLLRHCQQTLEEAFPHLAIRWARIYGNRWSYVCGKGEIPGASNSCRFQISPEYGVFIDNPEVLSRECLNTMIKLLKEVFAGEKSC